MIITADAIINGLNGKQSSGMCQCPAHEDGTPSLRVSTGKDGTVLLHCHAGCSQDAVIGALKNRGLWSKSKSTSRPSPGAKNHDDDMPPRQKDAARFRDAYIILRAASATKEKGPIAEYFKGRGIDTAPGNAMWLPAPAAHRFTGKRYPAIVFPVVKDDLLVGAQLTFLDKNGKSNLRGRDDKSIRRIFGPFKGGHVQLGEHADPDAPLIVSEGIEDGLAASQLTGFRAIAGLGANNLSHISPPPCSELIVAADNDDVGQDAAEDLKNRLVDMGRTVRIATPVEHKDWNAWLASGADRAELTEAILQAQRFSGMTRVRPLTMSEFMGLAFPAREFLLKPWLSTSALAMIHAQRGGAKTFLGMSVAYAVATGRPLMDWDVTRPARVMYVDGELPGVVLQHRLQMLGPSSPNLTILSREQFVLRQKQMVDLGTEKGREQLDRYIDESDAELVILDSLSTLVQSGVENETEAWQPIQDWAMEHRWRGRTIIMICHEGVQSGRPRGTTKREDVMDAMIGLKPYAGVTADCESAYELRFTKSREFCGDDALPRLVRLSTRSGFVEWTSEPVRDAIRDKVAEMINAGTAQKDIAKQLNLTKGRISQIVKELKLKGKIKDLDDA